MGVVYLIRDFEKRWNERAYSEPVLNISNMATEGEYDCIVIGAGVQGSFTAYHLATKNKKTLLLDQVCHTQNFDPWSLSY